MPLKLLTLNIEHDRHLDRVAQTIATHLPDVVCLQEVFEKDCAKLAAVGGYQVKYALSTLMPEGEKGNTSPRSWGVAVLTRVPVHNQTVAYYADDPRIRIFKESNDPRRLVVMTELQHEGRNFKIGTTHFTWSKNGATTDEQREDFARLKRVLLPYPDYVLCGDFNAPRGGEMFSKFTGELGLIDHLPPHVTTTLDSQFHYAGALELAVDNIFSTPEYRVTQVQVLEGISDHKGILAVVERRTL
ncbi:endonuclease/exonuclease/phosphatase family protein [Peristeroidobacter agariperforans]|uniref:endonuclease/exonuclease/phosphatase family protein n=1 Tax=Peristeroidobacter agariperforans TaxID=268404 RepID=UPI00101DEBB4|nr:endonuclease/exonuclease/phosphatase family protein [Peristeroidobacter agariperforans]